MTPTLLLSLLLTAQTPAEQPAGPGSTGPRQTQPNRIEPRRAGPNKTNTNKTLRKEKTEQRNTNNPYYRPAQEKGRGNRRDYNMPEGKIGPRKDTTKP